MPGIMTKVSPTVPTASSEPLDPNEIFVGSTTSHPISLARLIILVSSMTFLLVFVAYIIVTTLSTAYESRYGTPVMKNTRKSRRKNKPPPLNLHRDLEAQPRTEQLHMTSDNDKTPESSMDPWVSHIPAAVASGIDLENSPSPMRLRQLVPRMAVTVVEEASPLGLGRYFFADGVGIKRYESQGENVRWKED